MPAMALKNARTQAVAKRPNSKVPSALTAEPAIRIFRASDAIGQRSSTGTVNI